MPAGCVRHSRRRALVGAAESRSGSPGGRDQFGNRKTGRKHFVFSVATSCSFTSGWLTAGSDPARSTLPSALPVRGNGRAGPCRGASLNQARARMRRRTPAVLVETARNLLTWRDRSAGRDPRSSSSAGVSVRVVRVGDHVSGLQFFATHWCAPAGLFGEFPSRSRTASK